MYVRELTEQLNKYDGDVWVEVMFQNDGQVYTLTGTQEFELAQGQRRVVIDIADTAPLRAV